MRVLGIDPGLTITGFGCVEGDAVRPAIVEAGVIRLTKGKARPSVAERLVELDLEIRGVIESCEPDVVALEGMFANPKHPATVITMAHGRGVIMLAAQSMGVELVELKPAEVKKGMTGSGRATKEQIQTSVQHLFGLSELPTPADLADAIAIGVCGLRRGEVGARIVV